MEGGRNWLELTEITNRLNIILCLNILEENRFVIMHFEGAVRNSNCYFMIIFSALTLVHSWIGEGATEISATNVQNVDVQNVFGAYSAKATCKDHVSFYQFFHPFGLFHF